jgi:cysteine desulfurase
MTEREIYLDYNATAPPHPEVVGAMERARGDGWGNPSSVHAAGRRARRLVEDAREALAALAGVHPRDVVFTSGATEANNLALHAAPALVTSRLEHPSVARVAEALERAGRPVRWLSAPETGRLEPAAVARALEGLAPGAVVALAAANHETGVIQPVAEVAECCREGGARLHVDAVQALGKLWPEAWRGGDSLAVSAHKLGGPKGIGALLWRGSVPRPLLLGGAQERGLRAGTLDAVACAGFGAALERAKSSPGHQARLAVLRDRIEVELGVPVNGGGAPRLAHVSNLSLPGWRGDEVVAALDLLGVRVSSGSACSAGTQEPSAVVRAMVGEQRARSAVRISLGEQTSEADIAFVIDSLQRLCART